jgi:hypothetical protein
VGNCANVLLVAYIRKFKTGSGATGVQVCYKKGREVVKTVHVGSANSDVALEKLLKKAQKIIDEGKRPLFDLDEFDTIIIDGYVYLKDNEGQIKYGLGKHLRDSLSEYYLNRNVRKRLNIVGIAKTIYGDSSQYGICYRGESKKPLYITGLNNYHGKYGNLLCTFGLIRKIEKMSGNYRIPTIIKEVDTETKKYFK